MISIYITPWNILPFWLVFAFCSLRPRTLPAKMLHTLLIFLHRYIYTIGNFSRRHTHTHRPTIGILCRMLNYLHFGTQLLHRSMLGRSCKCTIDWKPRTHIYDIAFHGPSLASFAISHWCRNHFGSVWRSAISDVFPHQLVHYQFLMASESERRDNGSGNRGERAKEKQSD